MLADCNNRILFSPIRCVKHLHTNFRENRYFCPKKQHIFLRPCPKWQHQRAPLPSSHRFRIPQTHKTTKIVHQIPHTYPKCRPLQTDAPQNLITTTNLRHAKYMLHTTTNTRLHLVHLLPLHRQRLSGGRQKLDRGISYERVLQWS